MLNIQTTNKVIHIMTLSPVDVMYIHWSRLLFSSLLIALPRNEWFATDDTYVGAESEYIAELEREYFYIEGKAMSRLMVYLLETKTSLKAEKIRKVCVFAE